MSKSTALGFFAILAAVPAIKAATELTFFEITSCNAGTSFDGFNDANPLTSDTTCHTLPDGTTALYVNGIDEGCTIRTYADSQCDPAQATGLRISLGTCFYVDQDAPLLSWRADCPGVDYSGTTGLDTSNGYDGGITGTDDGGDETSPSDGPELSPDGEIGADTNGTSATGLQSILATATGVVTITSEPATASASESSDTTTSAPTTSTPTGVVIVETESPTDTAATETASGAGASETGSTDSNGAGSVAGMGMGMGGGSLVAALLGMGLWLL